MSEIYVRIEQRQVLARIEQAQPVVVIPIGAQGPRGEPGLPGGNLVEATAGQNLSSGRVVVMDGGAAWYFDPTNTAHAGRAYGVTTTSATAGAAVNVAVSGVIDDAAFSFSTDAALWAGADGEIFETVQAGALVQKAGVSIAGGTIKIDFSIQLKRI